MQALIELQRHCASLYSRLKDKLGLLVLKNRVTLVKLRARLLGNKCYNNGSEFVPGLEPYGYEYFFGNQQEHNGTERANHDHVTCCTLDSEAQASYGIINDLNRFLLFSQQQARQVAAVSIPMLLLPLAIQPPRAFDEMFKSGKSSKPQSMACTSGSHVYNDRLKRSYYGSNGSSGSVKSNNTGNVGTNKANRGQQLHWVDGRGWTNAERAESSGKLEADHLMRSCAQTQIKTCTISEILSNGRASVSLTGGQRTGQRELSSSSWSLSQTPSNHSSSLTIRNPLLAGCNTKRSRDLD